MEKSRHSSGGGDTTVTTASTTNNAASTTSSAISSSSSKNNSNRDAYLNHLNKISHKISKPIRRSTSFDQNTENLALPQVPSQNQAALTQSQPLAAQQQPPPLQHQPPVYNINKNDFRDVVQRLTGSPAHERFSTPPPIQPPKLPSSRLQRIRPPPLAQINSRPPQLPAPFGNPAGAAGFLAGQRQPLSPLPPFPAVHAAAESPISAYMRFLQSSAASAASPRWNSNNLSLPLQQQLPVLHHQQQNIPPPLPQQAVPQFPLLPTSPVPFGCIPSPRSPYGMLSPSLLFSPTQFGLPQLPLSPTLPVPIPKWKGI